MTYLTPYDLAQPMGRTTSHAGANLTGQWLSDLRALVLARPEQVPAPLAGDQELMTEALSILLDAQEQSDRLQWAYDLARRAGQSRLALEALAARQICLLAASRQLSQARAVVLMHRLTEPSLRAELEPLLPALFERLRQQALEEKELLQSLQSEAEALEAQMLTADAERLRSESLWREHHEQLRYQVHQLEADLFDARHPGLAAIESEWRRLTGEAARLEIAWEHVLAQRALPDSERCAVGVATAMQEILARLDKLEIARTLCLDLPEPNTTPAVSRAQGALAAAEQAYADCCGEQGSLTVLRHQARQNLLECKQKGSRLLDQRRQQLLRLKQQARQQVESLLSEPLAAFEARLLSLPLVSPAQELAWAQALANRIAREGYLPTKREQRRYHEICRRRESQP